MQLAACYKAFLANTPRSWCLNFQGFQGLRWHMKQKPLGFEITSTLAGKPGLSAQHFNCFSHFQVQVLQDMILFPLPTFHHTHSQLSHSCHVVCGIYFHQLPAQYFKLLLLIFHPSLNCNQLPVLSVQSSNPYFFLIVLNVSTTQETLNTWSLGPNLSTYCRTSRAQYIVMTLLMTKH